MKAISSLENSPIEPAYLALRELFEGPLRSVSFPGIDPSTVGALVDERLRREQRVQAARAAFAEAHRDLIAAEQALAEQQAALLAKSHLAVAYARVFAQEDDPELLEAIDRIVLPRMKAGSTMAGSSSTPTSPGPSGPPKRRGRPPKAPTPQVALPETSREAAGPGEAEARGSAPTDDVAAE